MRQYDTAIGHGDYIIITHDGKPVDPRDVLAELEALRAVAVAADKVLKAARYDQMRGWRTDGEPLDDIAIALSAAIDAGYLPVEETRP